jgi:hypothetical protein
MTPEKGGMKMSLQSRRECLERIRDRYARAGRQYKSKILDEFCQTCGYDRKYAIKLLRGPVRKRRRRPGPKPRYGPQERAVLAEIWRRSEYLCSKRLKAALPLWLPWYQRRYGRLPRRVRANLRAISAATIDRLLAPRRVQRGRALTRPGSLLRTQIPIRTDTWDITQPGFLEADSVAHCGQSMAGSFIWSITYTDICTGWTVLRAVWNRGAHEVLQRTREVEQRLPFPIRGFDCDNGSEFLNWHLVRYFTQRKRPVRFTRSRAYHKDDNAHVEQKNWTHVRQLLGYERFQDPSLLQPINDLYSQEWEMLHNFFCPSMKLLRKHRIQSRIVKKHDPPQTPYHRLLQSSAVSPTAKQQLRSTYHRLDPFQLTDALEGKLKRIFQLHRRTKLRKAS